MPIAVHIVTFNGAISEYHVVKRLEADFTKNLVMATVLSYTSEAAYLAGGTPVQSLPVKVPVEACVFPLEDAIHTFLTTDETSPYVGGIITADNSATLEAAQDRAWVRIKAFRSQREIGDFVYDGGIYQADIQRINGAATLALMASLTGKEYSIDWTLTDNTVRTLTGAQMMELGVAVGKFVDGIYTTARSLRAAIAATTTIEEADAITWPVGPSVAPAYIALEPVAA